MRMDYITKLVLYKLNADSYDRRGTIVTLSLREVPNMNYVASKAMQLMWRLTSLLSDHYNPRENWENYFDGINAEGNDCWIYYDKSEVRIRHKYWSDNRVAAFYEILLSLARLHDWEVVDERK